MTRTEHLLTCLSEECAEVIQNVSKVLRFGIDDEYSGTKNRDKLEIEINDIFAILEMLKKEGIDIKQNSDFIESKIERVETYILYAKERKTII